MAHTAEAIKMEITNQKQDLDYRKFKFNGITVLQNLKDYIPERITREEIKDMIFNAFGEGLVDDDRYYIASNQRPKISNEPEREPKYFNFDIIVSLNFSTAS